MGAGRCEAGRGKVGGGSRRRTWSRFMPCSGRLRAHARQWAAQTDDSVSDAVPAAAAAVLSLSISKLRQKATLIFRAKVPRLRTHAKQSKACSRTHSSSCSKCSKPAASQQHVGIGTVIDSACRMGNRELKSSKGMAVASAVVFHRPPSSARPAPGSPQVQRDLLARALCRRTLKLWQKATLIFPVDAAPLGP